MKYLEMAAFACIVLGTVVLLGASAYRLAQWWSNRHVRRNQQALRQAEDQSYDEMAKAAVREAEEFLRELRRR